jgi:FlaA1/EpsC-like NDP-sugar epimerase
MANAKNNGNDLNWDQLTGRERIICDSQNGSVNLAGKRVLVTGAAGFIGGALAKAISLSAPEQLVLLDSSEQGLYEMERSPMRDKEASRTATVLGNICDPYLLPAVFQQYKPQIIFHAAAFKHVPIMERNPFAAIANNALGTYDLAKVVASHGCEQMILVSTDKAADPLSLMGASKRIAEMILLTPQSGLTRRKVVRLGNVLGSPGSVVPIFLDQIASGGAVTVTHADARRYFMTDREAADALVCATSSEFGDGVFIPQLGEPIRILDLAMRLIETRKQELHNTPKILFTALRPGDKLEEVLISQSESWGEETLTNYAENTLRPVVSPVIPAKDLDDAMDDLRSSLQRRDLHDMLRTVLRLVPEYQPSELISAHLNATSVEVNS